MAIAAARGNLFDGGSKMRKSTAAAPRPNMSSSNPVASFHVAQAVKGASEELSTIQPDGSAITFRVYLLLLAIYQRMVTSPAADYVLQRRW